MEVKGHAGYDEYGKDIVCAAVSVLTVNMANSVEKFTDDGFKGSVDEKTGQFIFHFTGTVSCLLYTSPSPRDISGSRMPSSA